jgi:hypothetical protein
VTSTLTCRYCGLWIGEGGSGSVHGHCHDAAYYAAALTRVRGLDKLPPPGKLSGRHSKRALRRVALERYLEVLTGQAAT